MTDPLLEPITSTLAALIGLLEIVMGRVPATDASGQWRKLDVIHQWMTVSLAELRKIERGEP